MQYEGICECQAPSPNATATEYLSIEGYTRFKHATCYTTPPRDLKKRWFLEDMQIGPIYLGWWGKRRGAVTEGTNETYDKLSTFRKYHTLALKAGRFCHEVGYCYGFHLRIMGEKKESKEFRDWRNGGVTVPARLAFVPITLTAQFFGRAQNGTNCEEANFTESVDNAMQLQFGQEYSLNFDAFIKDGSRSSCMVDKMCLEEIPIETMEDDEWKCNCLWENKLHDPMCDQWNTCIEEKEAEYPEDLQLMADMIAMIENYVPEGQDTSNSFLQVLKGSACRHFLD